MPLGATIITFSPGTVIKSADANTNFSHINGATNLTGIAYTGSHITITGTTSLDSAAITSNGSGTWNTLRTLFTSGSISRISVFGQYTVTNSATFYDHNLGDIPDLVIMTTSSLHTTLHIATYEASSMTTTQVKLQADNNVEITGLAIKF